MSLVTNIILITGISDEIGIGELNRKFQQGTIFSEIDDSKIDYAGEKFIEAGIYLGAFNYLDLEELIKTIENTRWEYPKDVQLFVKEDNEDRFSEIKLNPKIYGD